ncbi:caspase domain-containing protein [Gymnopilus junonius]|uniref:Caspase domain-containing protein n=1 Tax=Gymnopilus junonius TaxID=109634 RepID=A0A9P5NHB4_GYMJU|nr:caspase domain-containing protein [Gymnopilus junonius]
MAFVGSGWLRLPFVPLKAHNLGFIVAKAAGKARWFYPLPKALMVALIYDTYEIPSSSRSVEDNTERLSLHDSLHPRDYAYPEPRCSCPHSRAVYTDSEHDDDDGSYSTPHRSNSHGRDYTLQCAVGTMITNLQYTAGTKMTIFTTQPAHHDGREHHNPLCRQQYIILQSDYGYPSFRMIIQRGRAPYHASAPGVFELLPPNRDFVWSKCTGRKKAVCIGINYTGSDSELKGCANDAKNMRQFLMEVYGFRSEDILLLTDEGHGHNSMRPTRKEIFNAMNWLVKGAHAHDSLFFHSMKIPVMVDKLLIRLGEKLTDKMKELHDSLVRPLPAGCRLTAIFDVRVNPSF